MKLLKVNGKSIWPDIKTKLSITAGAPIVFPDPENRQTLPVDGGVNSELIKQCIGEFHFLAAYEYKDLGINEPDSLYGKIVLSDRLFAELWQCVRTPNCKFNSVYLDVFGEAMQWVPSYGRQEFNWTVPSELRLAVPLHIASFMYWAGQGKYETAAAMR